MYYDLKIFQFINNFADHSYIIDVSGIFLADYLSYILTACLCILLFWPKKNISKNREMISLAILSALIARFLVKDIILLFYNRPRPYLFLPGVHRLIYSNMLGDFQSFPSGHMLFFFAISGVIYFYNKKLGIFFFIASVIMGIARVFVGVHWPSDILAGMILGLVTAYVVRYMYHKYKSI